MYINFPSGPCLLFVSSELMIVTWNTKLTTFGFQYEKKCSLFVLCDSIHPVWATQTSLQKYFLFFGPSVPLPCVFLCCYCESNVHYETVCIPWTQIGKSSTSCLGAECIIFHRKPDKINKGKKMCKSLLSVDSPQNKVLQIYRLFSQQIHGLQHEVLCGKYTKWRHWRSGISLLF